MNSLAAIGGVMHALTIQTIKRENRRQKERKKTYRVPESGERNDTQTQEDQWITTRIS